MSVRAEILFYRQFQKPVPSGFSENFVTIFVLVSIGSRSRGSGAKCVSLLDSTLTFL